MEKTQYTKKVNGLVEKFTYSRTTRDRTCYICNAEIKKGDQYAVGMKFWVTAPVVLTRGGYPIGGARTLGMPVCQPCASAPTPVRV